MDIISQLQEQVNSIAAITFNAFGTLQRDAPPVQLSPYYPQPIPPPPPATTTTDGDPPSPAFPDQPKQLSADLVKAAKQFDALVAALPLSQGGEEAQLKRIAQLQVENDVIGQQLQKQLEAAEKELKQVQELFGQAADNCLNLKKPESTLELGCIVWLGSVLSPMTMKNVCVVLEFLTFRYPGTGEYVDFNKQGIYGCTGCKTPLCKS